MNTSLKIPFTTQAVGYDREQVDKYVQKLADEYRNLQSKYTELSEKIDSNSRAIQSGNSNVEAISKALVDAEVKAIQIIAEARNEATKIVETAYAEIEQLQQQKERAILEIRDIVNVLKDMILSPPMQKSVNPINMINPINPMNQINPINPNDFLENQNQIRW